MLAALAVVPENDVVQAFETLVDTGNDDRAESLVHYFEDSFIGRPDRRGIRKRPSYPIFLWNVNQRVLEALPMTNN